MGAVRYDVRAFDAASNRNATIPSVKFTIAA